MPRTPDGPVARSESISFRGTKSTRAAIEKQRGKLSVSEYLRRLVVQDGKHHRTPKEPY